MFHDLDLKVKVTVRSKVKFTFIAISQSVLKVEQKCKTGVYLRLMAIHIKYFENYVTSGLRTCQAFKMFSP